MSPLLGKSGTGVLDVIVHLREAQRPGADQTCSRPGLVPREAGSLIR